ncbi:fused response regulator/thioredoxin-disulfide reductase [Nocardia terpenica]|uniref:Fused response regulator/thioredoxin-disulfide reductase n=1 Tax=Nocardia terpenica TaxID=455432 RepID=A0A164IXI7_9NOCA|nr:fused response regulator/thioredoxin-disulfide reductase [Nocardia terpenica]
MPTGLKPVVLSVDDDPVVSRAVVRDLRQRYGRKYQIIRAESGRQGLEVLREVKLRGQPVAVIIADYRMPEMDGLDFLERSIDSHPLARRVLLTAYAETAVAIDGINIVDLDHYLLKPWDPAEEKLYPVIDGLLESWCADDRKPVVQTKVIGSRWSARCSEVREFLARNQLAYRWYLVNEPEGDRLLRAAGVEEDRCPVVVTSTGKVLVRPGNAELAEVLGLTTSPSTGFYDAIVIGGGPAGLSAALTAASEGLRTVLIERTAPGGQAGQSSRIENYLGFPDGVSGAQLAERARRQALKFGAELVTTQNAVKLEVRGGARRVRFTDGSIIDGHTVVVATGVSYRRHPAAGISEFTGRGVYYGFAMTEATLCKGMNVHVVGGANSAGQASVYLSRTARSVAVIVRADSLHKSMSHYLIEQITNTPNIRVKLNTEVVEVGGNAHLERILVRNGTSGEEEELAGECLFLFIGAEPGTDWLADVLVRDDRGFLLTGPDLLADGGPIPGWTLDRPPQQLETNVPGVFVAGDVRAGSAKRVSSAVGEGVMAVMLVHRYLAQS